MIEVHNITPFTCEFYEPSGKSLGFLNEYEMNDLRIQIAKEGVEGYCAIYDYVIIPIQRTGRIDNWPPGFFDLIEHQYAELFKAQRK